MNRGALAMRQGAVHTRTMAAVATLSGRFALDVTMPEPAGPYARDPELRRLVEEEGIALFLDALVTATEPGEELPPQIERLADLTVRAIQERIAVADTDALDEIEILELDGKDRKGVHAAIAERREVLWNASENKPDGDAE